jgi:3-oxoadipate enol-lactonase
MSNADDMEIRGVDLNVQRLGTGPVMLWCHGLTSSIANEDERNLWTLAEPVTTAGYELIRYDARGHGKSAGSLEPADYGWSSLAIDAWALHDKLASSATDAWVVGGASMGAATTLHMAVSRPEQVRAMVLVIPPTAWETRAPQKDLYMGAVGFVKRNGKQKYVEANRRLPALPIFENHDFRTDPDIAEELLPTVLEGAANADFPSKELVGTLTMPTLILAWDTDPGHPVSTAEALAELLPDNRVSIARSYEEILGWSGQIGAFLGSL